jgi:hypothetical protein
VRGAFRSATSARCRNQTRVALHVAGHSDRHGTGFEGGRRGDRPRKTRMTAAIPNVALSTKCWEGDYRTILTADGIADLFGSLGPVAKRQVILNRIDDRQDAERLACRLVETGEIDQWFWAEKRWPDVARKLGLPEGWFGPAWPYSVPELCELDAASTDILLHIAGDVRFRAPTLWLLRAIRALDDFGAAVVAPTPPAGVDWVRERGRQVGEGWVETELFSDQIFLVRPGSVLDSSVMRAVHPASARYPKPGGALTFEARIGAWLALRDFKSLVDTSATYIHPVSGREGDSYHTSPLAASPEPFPPIGAHYPAARSATATGLVISRGNHSAVGAAVASLGWCSSVVAVDVLGSQAARHAARSAGAEVRTWTGVPRVEVARRQILSGMAGWIVDLQGDQVCTGVLAHRLAAGMQESSVSGFEASCRQWIGGRRPPRTNIGAPRRLVAYRCEGLTFGPPLEGFPPSPGGSVRNISPKGGAVVLHLRAPDLQALVDEVNLRSSWRAENLVLERTPTIRMPFARFVRSYLGGSWRFGRLGPQVAFLDAFEEMLMLQKWRDQVSGGGIAATAEFDQVARTELEGDSR